MRANDGVSMQTNTRNILHSKTKVVQNEQSAPVHGALLTMDQVATEACVSRRFLQLEIKRGRLAVCRLSPRVVRIRLAAWEAYLDKCETPAR
jgi:hypothetical protein